MFAFLVTNGNLTLVFDKGVNSIRGYKLSAVVARKKLSFLYCFYVSVVEVLLIVLFDDVHFSAIFLEVESMKPVQMFFEDCVASD